MGHTRNLDKHNFDKLQLIVGFIGEKLRLAGKTSQVIAIHQIHQCFTPSNFCGGAIYTVYIHQCSYISQVAIYIMILYVIESARLSGICAS